MRSCVLVVASYFSLLISLSSSSLFSFALRPLFVVLASHSSLTSLVFLMLVSFSCPSLYAHCSSANHLQRKGADGFCSGTVSPCVLFLYTSQVFSFQFSFQFLFSLLFPLFFLPLSIPVLGIEDRIEDGLKKADWRREWGSLPSLGTRIVVLQVYRSSCTSCPEGTRTRSLSFFQLATKNFSA